MGATHHMCHEKSCLNTYKEVEDGEKMCMGNVATVDIKGVGDVIRKMT